MEHRIIDLNKSVYELCNEFDNLSKILHDLGFVDIIKPGMIHTAGRFMTIKKGASLKKIDLDIIKEKLTQYGYKVID